MVPSDAHCGNLTWSAGIIGSRRCHAFRPKADFYDEEKEYSPRKSQVPVLMSIRNTVRFRVFISNQKYTLIFPGEKRERICQKRRSTLISWMNHAHGVRPPLHRGFKSKYCPSFTHSLIQPCIPSFIHWFVHSLIQLYMGIVHVPWWIVLRKMIPLFTRKFTFQCMVTGSPTGHVYDEIRTFCADVHHGDVLAW